MTATSVLPAANAPLAFPSFGGYAMSCLTPSGAPAGTTATITVSAIAQTGAPAAQSAARAAAGATRAASATTTTATATGATALLYARESFSTAFSTPSYPACTVTVPSGVATTGLTLELFDTSTGSLIAAASGGTATGSTVPFTFYTPGPWSIVADRGYLYELVSGSNLDLSFRPNQSGDAFTYAGKLSETFVRPPIQTPPTPNPNPASTQTLDANVGIDVGVSTTAAGSAAVSTFTSNETDAYTSPAQTVTSTTAETLAYSAPSTAGNVTVAETGAKTTTSNGVTTTTTIGAGNGLVDVLPEVAGPIAPANTAAETIAELDPSGQSSTQTYNADGSYAETVTYPTTTTGAAGSPQLTSTATEASDGSAVYDVPVLGVPGTSIVYGAPSGGQIPITLTVAAALTGTGSPLVQSFTIPAWYSNPNAPPVLYAQTYVNDGGTAMPASCGVPASLATGTNALVQTTTTVDTVFGEVETHTVTSYDAQRYGVVCMVLNDATQQYYDFTGQSASFFTFSGTGMALQSTTIAETLGLQSATVSGATASAVLRSGASALQTPLARATVARFDALVAHERTVRHAAALARLQASVKLMKGSH